jgi:hypothetical protein
VCLTVVFSATEASLLYFWAFLFLDWVTNSRAQRYCAAPAALRCRRGSRTKHIDTASFVILFCFSSVRTVGPRVCSLQGCRILAPNIGMNPARKRNDSKHVRSVILLLFSASFRSFWRTHYDRMTFDEFYWMQLVRIHSEF